MIIVQFDDRYHHWAVLFLRSLALHEVHPRVLADTVNLSAEQVAELRRAHPQVLVREDPARGTVTREEMANRKPFVLQQAMETYPDEPWYGLLDADFLVRQPLGALWAHLTDSPTALIVTNGYWAGKRYRHLLTPSGIVLLRPDGRALVDCWARWWHHDQPLASIKPRSWFWDQITLLEARDEVGLPYTPISMGRYADSSLSAYAAIWSANVSPDDKQRYYTAFEREHQRLLNARAGS